MRALPCLLALAILVPLLFGCESNARNGGASRTTLCELVASGAASDGRRVRIAAIFQTDGLENSVLIDDSCPNFAIALSSVNGPGADSSSIESFDRLAESDPFAGSGYRKIELDVTGVFHWRADRRPFGVLYMEKVWIAKRLE